MRPDWLKRLSAEQPVLIAGPTASGKSEIALQIAAAQGGVVVNADALQVFGNWRVLTARPSVEDEAQAPHCLYGHVPGHQSYSVGHWLRDATPLLSGAERPIIVGGTGLYFTALTEGLAEIPPTPPDVRQTADTLPTAEMLAALDAETAARIDTLNPMRVQRAWEVLTSTGRGLAAWQRETAPPLLPLGAAQPLVLNTDRDWLAERIDRRFDLMIAGGAIEEARANLSSFSPNLPSAKAIGARDLIEHLQGKLDLKDAISSAKLATRQYAKRQRTWFRSKMAEWRVILPSRV